MSEKLASGCNSSHTNGAASGAGSGIGGKDSVCIQTNKVYDACREGQCIGYRKNLSGYSLTCSSSSNSSVLAVFSL